MTLALGAGLSSMVTYGTASWQPAFYMRAHAVDAAQAGMVLALANGLGAGLGTVLGGSAAGWMARRDQHWLLWFPAATTAASVPLYFMAVTSESLTPSLIALAPAAFLGAVYSPAAMTAVHGVAGVALRATGIAFMLFVCNLLGLGGGALVVGFVSDMFISSDPQYSLRYGIIAVVGANVLAAIAYCAAARTLPADWQD
jgi:hypothetical protein